MDDPTRPFQVDQCCICSAYDFQHLPRCINATKVYPEVRPWEVEPYFSRNMLAMTAEDLHDKSAIAEQLAFRDQQIAYLREKLNAAKEKLLDEM